MEQQVQLGFSIPLENISSKTNKHLNFTHCNNNWLQWDGGKIGGKPIWLNPRDIPTNLSCTSEICRGHDALSKLSLLVQLYCPSDDVEDNAFHRTIYVFICNKCQSVRVLRCQLPRQNPFYVHEISSKKQKVFGECNMSSYWNVKLCSLCNKKSNDNVRWDNEKLSFCSNSCCEEYKNNYLHTNEVPELNNSNILLPESEIYVEEEPPSMSSSTNKKELIQDDEFDDDDENITQSDINKWTHTEGNTTGCTDPCTLEFQSRIHNREDSVQNQCLRYNRWYDKEEGNDEDENNGPLWIQENHIPGDDNIPNCQYCGSPRLFEFQIMPQMLYYIQRSNDTSKEKSNLKEMLLSNNNTGGIRNNFDWGVIAVYTCSKSCHKYTVLKDLDDNGNTNLDRDLGAYMEEYAWLQPQPPVMDE